MTTQDLGARGNKTQLFSFRSFVLCIDIKIFLFVSEDDFYQDHHGPADEHCGSFQLKKGQGEHHEVLALVWALPSPLKRVLKPLESTCATEGWFVGLLLVTVVVSLIYRCEFCHSCRKAPRGQERCCLLQRSIGSQSFQQRSFRGGAVGKSMQ